MSEASHARSHSLPLIMPGGNYLDRDEDEDGSAGSGVDPYGALQQSSPSSRARRRQSRKPATAAAAVGSGSGSLDMAHLSFRTLGSVPRMPGTTPSLREQLRMARMGANRPIPQVESERARTASKQAAHNMDVKARMNLLLKGRGGSGTQDRTVIQRLRKDNKTLTVQLAASKGELASARDEIAALREEIERLRSDGGSTQHSAVMAASSGSDGSGGGGGGDAGSSGGLGGGGGGSRPTSANRSSGSTPRARTPEMRIVSSGSRVGGGGSGSGSGSGGGSSSLARSSTSANVVVRRTSTARGLARSSTNDFAGFRARTNARMLRGNNGGAPSPPQLVVNFPWTITDLGLDDKSEDQLVLLKESGAVDAPALALLCKLFEVTRLLATAAASIGDTTAFCLRAQGLLEKMVGCEVANLWAVNTDGTVLLCRHDKDELPKAVPLTTGYVGQAFQNRSAVGVPSGLQGKPLFDAAADAHRVAGVASNLMAVPLVGNNQEVIGVLQLINRPNGEYTDVEESVLRQCGLLLGPIFQQCVRQMRGDTHLAASEAIIQVTSKLYSTLAAVSVDTEEPDKFDLRKTLQALQAQTQVFAERVTHGPVQVRVHLANGYSSVAVASMLATLPPSRLQDTQDVVLNRSANGVVGSVYHDGKPDYLVDAASSPVFNENVDVLPPDETYGTYTVPVAIGGHRKPLAVLQVVQPHDQSSSLRELHLRFYQSYANQVAFVLLYFFNVSTLQDRVQAQAQQLAQPPEKKGKKKQ